MKKADLERARRKGAITPFPGQNGFAIEGEFGDVGSYQGEDECEHGKDGGTTHLSTLSR